MKGEPKRFRRWGRGHLAGFLLVSIPFVTRPDMVSIPIPNGSFESPKTDFVNTSVGSWKKSDRPADYPEDGGFLWDQLAGVFRNTAPGTADNLVNLDGDQALYLFAVPGVAVFQDAVIVDQDDPGASSAFVATLTAGNRYTMRVGVLGQGGGMLEGVPLELMIYYRDERLDIVPLGTTIVTNSSALFQDRRHLVEFSVVTPMVLATDAWANKPLGLRMRSVVDDAMRGGYWDLENIRLYREFVQVPVPELSFHRDDATEGLLLTWQSRSGEVYDILQSSDFTDWTPLIVGMPGTGKSVELPVDTSTRQARFLKLLVRSQP